MRISFTLLVIWLAVHNLSCSATVAVNDSSAPNVNLHPIRDSANAVTAENETPLNSEDVVFFDGKNYIKRSGWLFPPRRGRETPDKTERMMPTKNGRDVRVTTTNFSFSSEKPWSYFEKFRYEGDDLDYLKGRLESTFCMEHTVNGKIFMYSIFAHRIILPSGHPLDEKHFVYLIQDTDGDGIFETLVHGEEILVPEWVIK